MLKEKSPLGIKLEASSFKSWKTAFLLSILIPIGLIAAFKKEPLTPENTQLEPIKWDFVRPTKDTYIDDKLNSTYLSADVSVSFLLIIGIYQENNMAYDGNDLLTMRVKINAAAINQNIAIENVYVMFEKDVESSKIDWLDTFFEFENLSLIGRSSGWTLNGKYKETYVSLIGISHPLEVSSAASAVWSLLSSNNQTHELGLKCEVTYFTGASYKKIIQLFRLTMVGE